MVSCCIVQAVALMMVAPSCGLPCSRRVVEYPNIVIVSGSRKVLIKSFMTRNIHSVRFQCLPGTKFTPFRTRSNTLGPEIDPHSVLLLSRQPTLCDAFRALWESQLNSGSQVKGPRPPTHAIKPHPQRTYTAVGMHCRPKLSSRFLNEWETVRARNKGRHNS